MLTMKSFAIALLCDDDILKFLKKKLQNEDTKYKYEVKFFIVCGEEKIIKKKEKKKVKKGKRHRNDLAVTVKRWRDLAYRWCNNTKKRFGR